MSDAAEIFSKAPEPSSVDPVTQASLPSWESFIEQAMNAYESPLIGYATTLLHDTDLARDVVQDVFLRLCQQDRAKVEENLKSWLFTVCRNRAFDVLRKNKRSEPMDDIRWKKVAGPDLPPDEVIAQQERHARVLGYLGQLTANQRELVLLKFQQNLSYQEIEQITGLKPGNIGFLIHTALTKLRKIIPDDLRR
jgi:RNA polymerase sigma factor (sigma-70 family)